MTSTTSDQLQDLEFQLNYLNEFFHSTSMADPAFRAKLQQEIDIVQDRIAQVKASLVEL